MCERWQSDFTKFFEDMGHPPDGTTLDRIDSDGNYEPGNCRWATPLEQSNNLRSNINLTIGGKTQSMSRWAKQCGVPLATVAARLRRGLSAEEALKRGGV